MIWNHVKTVILLAVLSALLMSLGSILGGYHGLQLAFIFSLIMNGVMYFFSDKIVLRMYGARPLDEGQHASIYAATRELAHGMGIPMPRLWIMRMPIANAFATGRNPRNGSIALTERIIEILDEDELRAVIAHELGHIKNRDILVTTLAATLASAIGYVASMLRYAAFWGTMGRSRDRNGGGNPLALLVAAIIMPIAAVLIQLAISRSREYLADESGAHYSRDPLALASALEKLHNHKAHAHFDRGDTQKASTASLFIVHPFTGNGWLSLFMTHPPVQARIKRLREIHQKMFSRA